MIYFYNNIHVNPLFYRYYKYTYYHIASCHEAETKLYQANTQTGTFLIRESESNPGSCSLSLYDGVSIIHFRIYNTNYKYYISNLVKFDSLNELVHYYMLTTDDVLYCRLTVPAPKPVNIPIKQNEMWEIQRLLIEVTKCSSVGEFGETFEGHWKYNFGPVMIKTNIATNITQERFFEEANILKKLDHKNIISLYGVCTGEYPFYIVTELMNNGNLNMYLRLSTNNLAPAELVHIATQVVSGMIYLEEQDYIHCDLRAENILVRDHNIFKIANFHLAQHLNGNKYYTVKKYNMLAIRWAAPEWYTLNQLSIKSDVWSFGILLWELATKGALPYPGMTNEEVMEAILKGYRMPIPEYCPEPFKQLMVNCWEYNEDERADFKNIFFH